MQKETPRKVLTNADAEAILLRLKRRVELRTGIRYLDQAFIGCSKTFELCNAVDSGVTTGEYL